MEGFRVVCGMRGGRLPLPGAGVSVGVLAIDFRGFQGQEGGAFSLAGGGKGLHHPKYMVGRFAVCPVSTSILGAAAIWAVCPGDFPGC